MANLNKVMLIGRLTREPEIRVFSNGGKVAKFGFAVNNRKKNMQTGQWEDEPVFVDVDAFNRGESGKQADLVEQYLHKGHQVFIEGHLKLDQWTAQDGQKRSRLHIIADNFQFLEPRGDGTGSPRGSAPARQTTNQPSSGGGGDEGYDHHDSHESHEPPHLDPAPAGRPTEDIPF
jgi:single-strand DNA-binding protein